MNGIVGYFRISREDLDRIGGDPNSVQWPPELGGGYIGFLESLHQIHCVVRSASLLFVNLGEPKHQHPMDK